MSSCSQMYRKAQASRAAQSFTRTSPNCFFDWCSPMGRASAQEGTSTARQDSRALAISSSVPVPSARHRSDPHAIQGVNRGIGGHGSAPSSRGTSRHSVRHSSGRDSCSLWGRARRTAARSQRRTAGHPGATPHDRPRGAAAQQTRSAGGPEDEGGGQEADFRCGSGVRHKRSVPPQHVNPRPILHVP